MGLVAVVMACSAPPAPTAPSATAIVTAAASPFATVQPRDLVVTAAGEVSGEHALVAQFTSTDDPNGGAQVHIWDVPLAGGSPRELVTYHRGARLLTDGDVFDLSRQLSPDARKLALTDPRDAAGAGLLVVDLVAGTTSTIPTGPADQPAWSPDGRRIAYRGYAATSPVTKETGIWVVDAAGGSPQQVWTSDQAPGTFRTTVYGWTADGSGVAITRDYASLSVIDVATRAISRVATGDEHGVAFRSKRPSIAMAVSDPTRPSSSPRGAPSSVGTAGRLEIQDTVGAVSRTAFHHDDVGTLLFDPRWSPISDEVLLHWVCGAGAAERDELVIVDAVKSTSRTLPVSTCVNRAVWSADGAKILYSSIPALRVRNADGSSDRELFHPALPAGARQSVVADVIAFAPGRP